jgi:regulator of sirC expression with transglutaminase-like and TPR domain
MHISEVRHRFAALVSRPHGGFRLAEGALLLAQEAYPNLRIEAYLRRLDTMAEAVKQRLGLELEPRRIVAAINAYLFDDQGFRGNMEHYYDPRNSFLNDVLDRQTGIPITLSVLYIDLGRHVGLPVAGVGMPGHFMVRYGAQEGSFWIDPFYGGTMLSRAECVERQQLMYGQRLPWHDAYLEPVSDHDILRRMLYNLKLIYLRQGAYRQALGVVERLLLLAPHLPTEVRDRGLLHYQFGHLEAALEDLQHYLQLQADASDAATITNHIAAIRRQLAR